jgi:bifunctional DNA-binding transcriptional regulator/antitoxin component of YhaV-PrlF toxin-antitoxin module
MKATLKVTAKGQITFRKAVLDELGVRPGDRVTVEIVAPGRLGCVRRLRASIDEFIGCAARPGGPALSLEEIERIIQDGWAGRK